MKSEKKIVSTISTLMVFLPWTILPLRMFNWALKSPVAEIIIISYGIFMIFSGLFTILSYIKAKAQNNLMKVCLIINSLYGILGVVLLGMMMNTYFM